MEDLKALFTILVVAYMVLYIPYLIIWKLITVSKKIVHKNKDHYYCTDDRLEAMVATPEGLVFKGETGNKNLLKESPSETEVNIADAINAEEFYSWLVREGYIKGMNN